MTSLLLRRPLKALVNKIKDLLEKIVKQMNMFFDFKYCTACVKGFKNGLSFGTIIPFLGIYPKK